MMVVVILFPEIPIILFMRTSLFLLLLNFHSPMERKRNPTFLLLMVERTDYKGIPCLLKRRPFPFRRHATSNGGWCELNPEDYTEQEISSCWYSKEEFSEITRKCVSLVSKIIKGKAEKYCVRGLDRMTPEVTAEREMIRLDAYIAVLSEQQQQNQQHIPPGGYKNSSSDVVVEAIVIAYRQAAATKSQELAYEIDCKDALVVANRRRR
jgi:hypothetical protein